MILTAAVQRGEAAQLTHSCRVHASFLEFMPPHQESRWSFYRCFVLCWGGGHACPPAVTHAAVIILLFEEYLAWHVVFPLQAREIGTKASIMVCKAGSLLLWMYMSWFSLSWIALFDHCRVAFDSALCVFFFMCSVRSCVQSCRKHKTQNIKIILTVAEELNVCL